MKSVLAVLAFLAAVSSAWPGPTASLELARDGRALAVIRLAREASPAEVTAARELADYLNRASSASFEIVEDGPAQPTGPTIEVGPTRLVREQDAGIAGLAPEEWVIRTQGEHLLLYGGRPRGTLYAVYRFLEDHVGVRWWTPYEESVPSTPVLAAPRVEARGAPVFGYRDLHGVDGPRAFNARNRINGDRSLLSWGYGGAEAYGPPSHVHNFYDYVPPEQFYETHPEFFSEVVGLRYAGKGQLCLTNEALLEVVLARLVRNIELSRRGAAARGEPPPRLFNFSQNDWGGACTCGPCSALAAREESEAGPLIAFVNWLAEEIADVYPDVLIDTLAYGHTLAPPRHLRVADNVTVRVTGLHQRDFAKRVSHPANEPYLAALNGWREKALHLRVWDYPRNYAQEGELPLPNLRWLADDFRLYRDLGVEGIFVENGAPVAGDMRDLKLWVIAKLLEDPGRDPRALVEEFTDGYYGPAGPAIRCYLSRLERAVARKPPTIRYRPGVEDFVHLDRRLIVRGQRSFDRAERLAAGDPDLLRRIRHARLTLDRATILRWRELEAERPLPFDRLEVIRRYRTTSHAQIELRLDEDEWNDAKDEVEELFSFLDAAENG